MPLEYWAQVFLECHLPCSGIAEPSLYVFQIQCGLKEVKKVTIPDSLRGGHVPLVPPPPPTSAAYFKPIYDNM